MLDEIKFSDRGDAPTEFELRLLVQSTDNNSAWVCLGRRLISEFGAEIGARAFAAMLDEFGLEKIRVPTRRNFFRALWIKERNTIIRDLLARDDWTSRDIARAFGIDHSRVLRIGGASTGRHVNPRVVDSTP